MRGNHIFGEARATQCARKVPSKPLRGRWGSVTSAENALLVSTSEELSVVFEAACVSGQKAKAKAKESTRDADDVELGYIEEDSAEYSKRMGRWRVDSLRGLRFPYLNKLSE